MIKLEILQAFTLKTSCGVVDKILEKHELGHAFESRAPALFYFQTRKYLRIELKFLDFLRSLD